MKQTFRLLLAALTIVLGLASCAEKDTPVDPNPLAKQVSGMWWSLADQEGTYKDATDSYPYTRMGQAICFNEDGTGYGVTFFFNDEQGDPIAIIGGDGMCPFTYTSKADGRLSLDFSDAYYEYADYFKKWTMSYANEAVTATNGKLTLTLEKPSDAMAQTIRDWDEQFNGGAAIGGSGFNPNDEDFTFDNWRNEPGIYLYDGTGEYTITQKGRTCKFSLVPLPWYEGTKLTNLPDGFCDDITPENGWELALNLCGNTEGSIKNNNFFALYNKYLGILRFFYFMPEGFTSGNDHVWQVSISDPLAQHSLYGYGVPSDRNITNKAALRQTGSETFMEYVTPWVDYQSSDGLVVPNAGWWAFDVDLSMYRANANHDTKSNIKLQMRSWDKHATSLYSAMTADIDGTLKADLKLDKIAKKSSNSAKGLLLGMQAVAQAGSAVASALTPNWPMALGSVAGFFGTCSQISALGSEDNSLNFKGSLDGTINLGLKGDINTSGVIDGSKTITGIPSPTLSLNDFDLKNSHVGQGVWNLKTAPVVYWTKETVQFNELIAGYDRTRIATWKFSPYFFDPSSIELELNPSVFPEDQIEWIQVDAICGARAENQPANDALREAYGATGPTKYSYDHDAVGTLGLMEDFGQKNCLWDFLYNHNDKCGMEELHTIYQIQKTYIDNVGDEWLGVYTRESIRGRGINGYAIEPQFEAEPAYTFIPFLEVNVKVLVKMKGIKQPIVLSRNYLPDIREYVDGSEFLASTKKTRPYASKMTGHTDLYDYQMKRISDIIERYGLYPVNVNLSTLTSGYMVKNGQTLTGTLESKVKISITDGATVTLDGVTINGTNDYDYKWAGITCEGNATIILKGTNTVRGFYSNYPGVRVLKDKTLTIKGNGTLTVSSNGYGAGIGGGFNYAGGNIVIEGGIINATGGNSAGIGCGYDSSCGNITISGGTINATGGVSAAGIGSSNYGSCGNITITNGVTSVTATKGKYAPYSIGEGEYGTCGTVTIGGKVTGNIKTSPYTYKP